MCTVYDKMFGFRKYSSVKNGIKRNEEGKQKEGKAQCKYNYTLKSIYKKIMKSFPLHK